MNVFVESNFVLEVALEQQEASFCETLLGLAERGKIRLLLPAYSLVEPHETLTRRRLDRDALSSRISSELTQVARSAPFAERARASQELANLLAESSQYETTRIEEVNARACAVAEILPIDVHVLRAIAQSQKKFRLTPQDAVVYASIRARLQLDHATGSCFVSRNPADFNDPDLRQDLATLNCKYFSSFKMALQYIRHMLGYEPTPDVAPPLTPSC